MPITLMLLVIMLVVFALQACSGVDIISPTADDMVRWGANRLELTTSGEPWRLITSGFLHIGIVHLLINCFVLFFFGWVAERLYGSWQTLLLFLFSAVGGSFLTNLTEWFRLNQQAEKFAQYSLAGNDIIIIHNTPITSAGASTGIMGVGGALLVLAWLNPNRFYQRQNPQHLITPRFLTIILLGSLLFGYFDPIADNAGHVGGVLVGILIGLIFTKVSTKS